MPRTIQTFEVSLKAAIFGDGRLLLVQEADTGYWELPGGRIDVGEEREAHASILARELREELGNDVRLTFRNEVVSWVRQRPVDGVFQFLASRLADFESGEIALSAEHSALQWTVPTAWSSMHFPPLSDYTDALQRIWKLRDRYSSLK